VDPSFLQDLHQQLDSVASFSSSFNLADVLDADAVTSAAATAVNAVPDGAAGVAADTSGGGGFGFLAAPIEGALEILHSIFSSVGMTSDSWGVAIVAMTFLIKLLTFPLTKTQMESTVKMQAIQPQMKELQAKYQSNPEVMNQKIAEMYQANGVNPLAGCLPAFVQIPIFIGLYRAVLNLAKEDKLNEPFLFLPSLEGPTYGADPTHGIDWLTQGWVDGVPSLGWGDTTSFLILPVLLVVSQFVSTQLMQPKNSEATNNIVFKILPLMIGWFSLSAPSALSIYWLTNTIVTSGISVAIKSSLPDTDAIATGSTAGGAAAAAAAPSAGIFAPPREKAVGFAPSEPAVTDVKPITSVAEAVDAEIINVEEGDGEDPETGTGMVTQSSGSKKRGGSKKKRKRRK